MIPCSCPQLCFPAHAQMEAGGVRFDVASHGTRKEEKTDDSMNLVPVQREGERLGIYEQLPEVKKKREEEKRKSEYKSYWLRAQHYKMKVTNHLLGRKVPWD